LEELETCDEGFLTTPKRRRERGKSRRPPGLGGTQKFNRSQPQKNNENDKRGEQGKKFHLYLLEQKALPCHFFALQVLKREKYSKEQMLEDR